MLSIASEAGAIRPLSVTMASFPHNNRTFQILDAAAKGGFAVGAYNWYERQADLSENCGSWPR